MSSKHKIKTHLLVADIRAGMSDGQLMAKYSVSENCLHNLLRKLILMRSLHLSEVQALFTSGPRESAFPERRKEHRYYVFVPLSIYDIDNLLEEGQVIDISEGGLRVTGLNVEVGEKRPLLIQPDYFVNALPFVFEAECRWICRSKRQPQITGFQITNISAKSLIELDKIIRVLTIRKYSPHH